MLKLTHKAIARMAGYRVIEAGYGRWEYTDLGDIDYVGPFSTEDAAYKACCQWCGLVEDE